MRRHYPRQQAARPTTAPAGSGRLSEASSATCAMQAGALLRSRRMPNRQSMLSVSGAIVRADDEVFAEVEGRTRQAGVDSGSPRRSSLIRLPLPVIRRPPAQTVFIGQRRMIGEPRLFQMRHNECRRPFALRRLRSTVIPASGSRTTPSRRISPTSSSGCLPVQQALHRPVGFQGRAGTQIPLRRQRPARRRRSERGLGPHSGLQIAQPGHLQPALSKLAE